MTAEYPGIVKVELIELNLCVVECQPDPEVTETLGLLGLKAGRKNLEVKTRSQNDDKTHEARLLSLLQIPENTLTIDANDRITEKIDFTFISL